MPSGATLLDIGAGHGVFSVLVRERGAHPTAVDPDVRKVRTLEGIQSVIGYDDCIGGTFDVVAMMDVLYTFPIDQWDALLDRLRHRLKPGGILIVKEHDPTARVKQLWNRTQERLTAVVRLTLAEAFSYERPEAFIARLRRHGFQSIESRRIDTGYPHPHMLYIARL